VDAVLDLSVELRRIADALDAGGAGYALAGGFAVSIYTPTESVVAEKQGPQTPQ
jgi:hypothetical protein